MKNLEMIERAIKLSVYGRQRCFNAFRRAALANDRNYDKVIEMALSEMENDLFCKQHNTDNVSKLHLWIDRQIEKNIF